VYFTLFQSWIKDQKSVQLPSTSRRGVIHPITAVHIVTQMTLCMRCIWESKNVQLTLCILSIIYLIYICSTNIQINNNNNNDRFASVVIRLFTLKFSFVRWRKPVYVHINMCRTFSPRWETIRLSFFYSGHAFESTNSS